jgi:hypothetical protein
LGVAIEYRVSGSLQVCGAEGRCLDCAGEGAYRREPHQPPIRQITSVTKPAMISAIYDLGRIPILDVVWVVNVGLAGDLRSARVVRAHFQYRWPCLLSLRIELPAGIPWPPPMRGMLSGVPVGFPGLSCPAMCSYGANSRL